MYCKNCGAQTDDNSVFCQKCGSAVTTANVISNDIQNSSVYNQQPKARLTGLAIAGFVLGIAGVLLFPIFGLLSLIFGIIAFANNPREQGEMTKAIWKYKNKARGFGLASISLGAICMVLLIISIAMSTLTVPFSPFNFNFGSKIDEEGYKSIAQEHMHDVHDASMEPFANGGIDTTDESAYEVEVNLNDTGAIISFKGYQSFDGYYLGIPNTIQLSKDGKVLSCEWCSLKIGSEQDGITSANSESNSDQTSSADEQVSSQNPNDSFIDSTCPRCGRALTDGETSCECTWCDICNAWMLGHGHAEEGVSADSSAAQNSADSTSSQNQTDSTSDIDPIAPEVLSATPRVNADGDASILLDITISDLSIGEQSPSHYNAGDNLTITVNGATVNHETAWWGGTKWQIQIDDINLSDTKTFVVVLTNQYGLSTTRTVTFS